MGAPQGYQAAVGGTPGGGGYQPPKPNAVPALASRDSGFTPARTMASATNSAGGSQSSVQQHTQKAVQKEPVQTAPKKKEPEDLLGDDASVPVDLLGGGQSSLG